MPTPKPGPCNPACNDFVELIEGEIEHCSSKSSGFAKLAGYRYINIFVEFDQKQLDLEPVDLRIAFSIDERGKFLAERYVNLEANLTGPQGTNFMEACGADSWRDAKMAVACYIVRIPVMGPFIRVTAFNRSAVARHVTVIGYLVS